MLPKLRGIHVGVLMLMLAAQIIGVVTLLSDHTFHLYENTGAVANARIEVGPEGASPGLSGDGGPVDLHVMNAAHCTLYRGLCQSRRRCRRAN